MRIGAPGVCPVHAPGGTTGSAGAVLAPRGRGRLTVDAPPDRTRRAFRALPPVLCRHCLACLPARRDRSRLDSGELGPRPARICSGLGRRAVARLPATDLVVSVPRGGHGSEPAAVRGTRRPGLKRHVGWTRSICSGGLKCAAASLQVCRAADRWLSVNRLAGRRRPASTASIRPSLMAV